MIIIIIIRIRILIKIRRCCTLDKPISAQYLGLFDVNYYLDQTGKLCYFSRPNVGCFLISQRIISCRYLDVPRCTPRNSFKLSLKYVNDNIKQASKTA